MKVYALLLFVVGCRSLQWKPINDFKDTCTELSKAAVDTILSIQKVIDTSIQQSKLFVNDSYSNNRILNRISMMNLSGDSCFKNFIQKENLELSYLIQLYQVQIPLKSRIEDIKERLNTFNFSLDIFQILAETKYRNCKLPNGRCIEETNDWLQSTIDSFYCTIYPDCSSHSIRKRSNCDGFTCSDNKCIKPSWFCDGECDCKTCDDEPSGCVKQCDQFRCEETFRCIDLNAVCDGKDDCGDGTDEKGCPLNQSYNHTHEVCSIKSGNFLCSNMLCIGLEKVCDGYNDCGDGSDENGQCDGPQCSSECGRKGGVCFTGPNGSECLHECPPGTFETSKGCARSPEAPLPTLFEVIADTPRLLMRYTTRVKYLKTKTIVGFSRVLRDIVNCKQREFTLLSRVIDFSTIIHEEDSSPKKGPKVDLDAPNLPGDLSSSTSKPTTEYKTADYNDY